MYIRFLLNKDYLKDIPFKNKIYKNTISPGKWHNWLLYYQKNFKVKESYAFQIVFNFCKSKIINNILNFSYIPKK